MTLGFIVRVIQVVLFCAGLVVQFLATLSLDAVVMVAGVLLGFLVKLLM